MQYRDKIAELLIHLRRQHGMSQHAMGEVIGVSAQQIQKYEAGTNRISADRFMCLCDYFYPVSHHDAVHQLESLVGQLRDTHSMFLLYRTAHELLHQER